MRYSDCGHSFSAGAQCPVCADTLGQPPIQKPPRSPSAALSDEFFAPGTLFAGRYRIVHRLGKGGIGEVYQADDTRLDQKVALKFLFPAHAGDARALERFREEARLARRVTHAGVCRIHDFGTAQGRAYVSMEHFEGEDLASLRRRVGRLARERAREIALELCAGLGAIHEQGILHRDLKPANVMLDGQGRVRILDFGLAVQAEAVSGPEALNGTPAYMAPEQAAGREATARSDLYSLGLILWELWTGEFLHPEDRQTPPLLSSRVEGIDMALDRIVARCLDPDPQRRPASAEAVATALREALTVQPGLAPRAVLVFEPSTLATDPPAFLAELLESFGGQRVWDGVGCVWLFERTWDAVSFAVALRGRLEQPASLQMVVDVQEVELRLRRSTGCGLMAMVGNAATTAWALLKLAHPGQTLLTGTACHFARDGGRILEGGEGLTWRSHGIYSLRDSDDSVEVFEVGREGQAPFVAPGVATASGPGVSVAPMAPGTPVIGDPLPGWRPAPGVIVPQRGNFVISRRLGEGGFGEAWLARHIKTGERRVFKFCFDGSRVRGLRREITLFRLFKEELGDRGDIARVLDWNLSEAPYFIESEYSVGGNLQDWADDQGGLDKVPMAQRLELIAQVADALAAAHSVGVLHKDVKPANILIHPGRDGSFQAQLADFGVGLALDKERLKAANITAAGITTLSTERGRDSGRGTRLYMAPEVLEGHAPTTQADIYSLGVVFYQVVIGHLGRAVGPGWAQRLDDPLLFDDLAAALHSDPEKRLASAHELVVRLRTLDARRTEAREAERRWQEKSRRHLRRKQAARRRRIIVGVTFLLSLLTLTGWALHKSKKEASARREAEAVTEFVIGLFDVADPYSTEQPGVEVPELSAVDLLDLGVERLETSFQNEPRVHARLLNKLGVVFGELGKQQRARELLRQALAIREETLGPEDLEVAESLLALGALESSGAPRESEALLRRALEIRRRHLPEEHLEIAESQHELAVNLWLQGAYQEAEILFQDTLTLRRHLLGEDHADVAESLNGLAQVLKAQGSYTEAEGLYRDALAMWRRLLGEEHPAVARALNNLAFVLKSQGSYTEAEGLYRDALAMYRRLLGEEHPDVATALNNLALVLESQGSYTEAEGLYRDAVAIWQRLLGSDHLYVAIGLNNLAQVLINLDQIPEAEQRIQESLKIFRHVYAPDHWRIANAEAIEAAVWVAQGQFEKSEPILLASYRAVSEDGGPQSPYSRRILQYLIDLYEVWGKPEEATRYRELWVESGEQP